MTPCEKIIESAVSEKAGMFFLFSLLLCNYSNICGIFSDRFITDFRGSVIEKFLKIH